MMKRYAKRLQFFMSDHGITLGVWLVTSLVLIVLAIIVPIYLPLRILLIVIAAVAGFMFIIGRDFWEEYWSRVIAAVLLLYALMMASTDVMYHVSATDPDQRTSRDHLQHLFDASNPGTILALFLAIITLLGFVITISKLDEVHIRITSYDRFLRRVDSLLRRVQSQTKRQKGSPEQELKVICSVPTLGNLSNQELFIRSVYYKWRRLANDRNLTIKMLCLNYLPASAVALEHVLPMNEVTWGFDYRDLSEFEGTGSANRLRDELLDTTDVGRFYQKFRTRGYSEAECRRALTQAVDVLRSINRSDRNTVRNYVPESAEEPSFHLVWSRARAIVALPLDRDLSMGKTKVTMVGIETADTDVIDRLNDVFEAVWDKVKQGE